MAILEVPQGHFSDNRDFTKFTKS